MPNQKNYPDKLTGQQDFRPARLTQKDLDIIQEINLDGSAQQANVVFGVTDRDVVELYVYDDLNQIIAHTNIRPSDEALRLIAFTPSQSDPVGIGQDLTPDFLQLNLTDVINRLDISPGRYSVTLNYFRDEVGKEFEWDDLLIELASRGLELFEGVLYRPGSILSGSDGLTLDEGATPVTRRRGNRLFIADISPSRTELRLKGVDESFELLNQIREFVEPSVPVFVAQGVVDQATGETIPNEILNDSGIPTNSILESERIKWDPVKTQILESPVQLAAPAKWKIKNRLKNANLENELYIAYQETMAIIRDKIIEVLVSATENGQDVQIQENELIKHVQRGAYLAILDAVSIGIIDPRLGMLNFFNCLITPTSTQQREVDDCHENLPIVVGSDTSIP